jgi:tight adherence protein C
MTTVEMLLLAVLGAGVALALGGFRWFRLVPLPERLRPYLPATASTPGQVSGSSAASVLVPLIRTGASRLGRTVGNSADLGRRLERAGRPVDAARFRTQQLVHVLVGLALGAMVALVLRPGALVATLVVLGPPVLAALLDEQQLDSAIAARRRRLQLELPVVTEQLAILIDAGYSLAAALARVGRRGEGIAAGDLVVVGRRIRQGLSVSDALDEWAARHDLDAVRRLVGVLALHRDAGDLGHLVAGEARAMRSEEHRALLERIERRSQLVWIPVTVATLVPGLLFLAVPFVSALSRVTGT